MNRNQRKELLRHLERLEKSADDFFDFSLSFYDISTKEILQRRYRMLSCIKLLQIFGMNVPADMKIPDICESFGIAPFSETEDEYEDFSNHMEQEHQLHEMGQSFLSAVLKNTGWKILFMKTMEDYMELEKPILKNIHESVSIHLGLILSCDRRIETHQKAEIFTNQTGIEADKEMLWEKFHDNFEPMMNVILLNERIEEMLCICQEEDRYKEWEEYKDIQELLPLYLFDAFFASYSVCQDISMEKEEKKESWKYLNYMLGEGVFDQIETVNFSMLCYESAVRFLLADMVAEEFLDRYGTKNGGKNELQRKKA